MSQCDFPDDSPDDFPDDSPGISQLLAPIFERHGRDATRLLQILREVHEVNHCICDGAVDLIAAHLDIPRVRVEGVAGFYSFLTSGQSCGEYRILFSDNITDHMLGKAELMEYFCKKLWVEPGKVSEDGLVSVDSTSCTGMCDQGPAALVNGMPLTNLDENSLDLICELVRSKKPVAEWPPMLFEVQDNILRKDVLLGEVFEPGAALKATLARGAKETLAEMDKSNLRGRGGAGFKTASKWSFCHAAIVEEEGSVICDIGGTGNKSERIMVCNADEGEPGTFKDRVLLNSYADLVFEGMTVGARVVGARRGFIYVRGEYRYLRDKLEGVLQRRREQGLLGKNILGEQGFDFDIEIHLGAGAYICGEESALIESLEGKRGRPRNRPPFPVTHGYLGQPTVVDNVETFACAAKIAQHGGAWFAAMGTAQSAGTKILSISGDCERRGIYEYPFGTTIRQILQDCGAEDTYAVQVSGPSGTTISWKEFDRKIAFEDLATAGAFMIFKRKRDLFQMARNFSHFFAHESCGFCTPCRVGTTLLQRIMDKIDGGHGTASDLEEMKSLGHLLKTMSHCGLGTSAANSVLDTLNKFPDVYEQKLKALAFEPAFDLDGALSTARHITGRDDQAAHLGGGAMSKTITIDGKTIPFQDGQTIMDAALAAGVYIPHLCHNPEFTPHGSCKLCTVNVNGRNVASCTMPATEGQQVANDTAELNAERLALTQMLFVEGNHFCPFCEKSGNCNLQAVAYHLGMMTPHYNHFYPAREVDASHPDILLDRNRCILCELCVRASRDVDGKEVFGLSGRGIKCNLVVNSSSGLLVDTDLQATDKAAKVCPTGAIIVKRHGFSVPIGERIFDHKDISQVQVEAAQMEGNHE